MAYVITEPCINVKDAACVEVCPCDCIHPTKDEPGYSTALQLYIDAEECIDCGACEPECPVSAIFIEEDVPPEWQRYVALNAAAFEREPAH
jgi:NAD-dependent dihydropyrimidine dehydrogenase PreA subunit